MANAAAGCASSLIFHIQGDAAGWAGREAQCCLLRCIFDPSPLRLVVIDRSLVAWNESCVKNLAATIYEGRAFERMPLLADAMEEAGCTDIQILAHCREQGGHHVRGCWVADLLLGKS